MISFHAPVLIYSCHDPTKMFVVDLLTLYSEFGHCESSKSSDFVGTQATIRENSCFIKGLSEEISNNLSQKIVTSYRGFTKDLVF